MKYLRTYEQAIKQATEITYDKFFKYIWDSKHFGNRFLISDDKPIYRSIDLTNII